MNNIRTIPKQKFRIAYLAAVLLVSMASISCSTWINSDWGDCGYSAFYSTVDNGGKPEIVFSEITAETVGGHRNCGFKYIKTWVDRAEIDGTVLPDRAEADKMGTNTYYYGVPAGIDQENAVITIQKDGKKYRSVHPSLKKETSPNVHVKMERAWW